MGATWVGAGGAASCSAAARVAVGLLFAGGPAGCVACACGGTLVRKSAAMPSRVTYPNLGSFPGGDVDLAAHRLLLLLGPL